MSYRVLLNERAAGQLEALLSSLARSIQVIGNPQQCLAIPTGWSILETG